MPWRRTNVREQRIEFVVRAMHRQGTFSALCQEFEITRPTGYRWLRRYQEAGSLDELRERSRRPRHSPTRTAEAIERRVVALRRRYGWGGKKLKVLLAREGIALPVVTINRIIARRGLVAERDRHRRLTARFERQQPNELWQIDFTGQWRTSPGWCFPLAIIDDHSRYLIALEALPAQGGRLVERCLVETFKRHGVPEATLCDHGTPWWSTSNSQGLTFVSVGLLKQGIRLYYSGYRHPQTQGKVERLHRTLKDALRPGGFPRRLDQCQRAFDRFRHVYNHVRPHEALDLSVPARSYRPSPHRYTSPPTQWCYPPGADLHRLNSQGCLDYHGQRYFVCEALAGERVWLRPFDGKLLVQFRHMYVREIDPRTHSTRAVITPADHPLPHTPQCNGCHDTHCNA